MICRFLGFLLLVAATVYAGEPALAQSAQTAPATRPASTPMLIVTRPNELLYVGLAARVRVNGQDFASLSAGQSHSGALRSGTNIITADHWSIIGRYSIAFNAQPGKTYRLAVLPRTENFFGGVTSDAVSALPGASVQERTGAFKITVGK